MVEINTGNEYRIIVKNKQTIDGRTETIEEIAYGNYYEKNGKQYILYKTENDDDKTSSMIKVDKDTIQIKRSGSVNSLMVYKAGENRKFMYEIPYGTIEMELETEKIISMLEEKGGEIRLLYTLSVQGEKYFNDMVITVVKR